MRRLIEILTIGMITACGCLLLVPAHSLAADKTVTCPSGQIATSNGCCPTEEAQYDGSTLSCPSDAQLCSTGGENGSTGQQADATGCLFTKYINPLINLFSVLVGVAVVVGVIWGGIEYVTSAGDPQKAASGRKHIINALLALVAYGLLYAFLQFMVPGGVLNGQ